MTAPTSIDPMLLSVFPGTSEMAVRCRAFDWESTSLGVVSGWSPALRMIVRTALESPFPTNLWCEPGLALIYNDAYRAILGDKHPHALGQPGATVWGEIWSDIALLFMRMREGGEPAFHEGARFVMEREQGHADDATFTFSLSPVRDEDGTIAAFLNLVVETTERDRVDHLLRESEQARAGAEASHARYRFLADAIPVQVWTARPDGALDFVSDRTAEFLGMSNAELLGSGWLSALHAEDIDRSAQRWTESLSSGEPYEIEFRIWSAPHAAYRWHLVRATAQRSESGDIIGWFGTNTDIDDWKSAQSELQRLTTEAQEANRSKGDFLAAMSHELRTPLNAIGGYAQLLELGVRGPVTDEQKLDLRRIQKSKAHLDGLVSGVLDFAKLGAGQIELRIVSLDVESMLTSVIEMIMPQLAEKGLTLAPFELPAGLSVEGDVDKTRQILLNLLSNALKFTRSGGTLSLAVRGNVGTVEIDVSDTGIGVAGEQLERIFEPFVQSKSPLHVAGIGVGLGLAISRTLARAMHGDVSVSSVLGSGSTFTLTLPRSR